MELTSQYLQTQFCMFNDAYFGGKLPEPRFELGNARTILGQFSCKRRVRWLRLGHSHTDYAIRMSKYYDMPERELQNVLLHEMIHYYITFTGMNDSSPHGPKFRGMMNRLNTEYGWDIRVRTNTSRWQPSAAKNTRTRCALAITTQEGKHYLTVVNRHYVRKIDSIARNSAIVASHQWLAANDPYFNNFPDARTLRGRRVSREFFDAITKMFPELNVTDLEE